MSYSSALQISGGGDYLLPSQQCIKPLRSLNDRKSKENTQRSKILKLNTEEDEEALFELNATGKLEKLNPVNISLSDCLACSGCITSSEAILVNNQSIEEFLAVLQSEPRKQLVISLSAESRASMATKFQMSLKETHQRIVEFLKREFDAKFVLDLSFARDISLIESAREFTHSFRSSPKYSHLINKNKNNNNNDSNNNNSENNSHDNYNNNNKMNNKGRMRDCGKEKNKEEGKFPIICGACPGWICYVEKTQEEAIPFLSHVKSPQQIIGSLVKSLLPLPLPLPLEGEEKKTKEIYHVSIMACYDKKLEASRGDFFDEKNQIRHVDCVLTTTELIDLLRLKNVNFAELPLSPLSLQPYTSINEEGEITGVKGGSGGYAEYILQYAARELFSIANPIIHSKSKPKNADFVDLWVENDQGDVLLKFAKAYGFRNIQNLVRLIKRKKCEYDYIEVMACPSGCSNGGGQIKAEDNQTAKALANEVESNYNSAISVDPLCNLNVVQFYEKLAELKENEVRDLLFTSFHAIEKIETQTALKW